MADAVLLHRYSFRALVLSAYHWTASKEGSKQPRAAHPNGLSIGARCFLVALDQHRSESSPQPFPSQETLAAECGCSEDSIARFLREARDAGWVERIERGLTFRGRLTPVYNLMVPDAVLTAWSANTGAKVPRNLRTANPADCGPDQPRNLRPYIDNLIDITTMNKEQLHDSSRRAGRKPRTGTDDPLFCDAMRDYPRRAGSNPRHVAFRAWNARLAEGAEPAAMLAGVRRYAAYCRASNRLGTEYVMQACRFFGPNKEYEDAWEPPPREQRDARYAPPLPVAPREPSVGPQQFGDVMRRAMGEAVAGPRYVCAREPHMLLRGVTYPCGAEVPADLVTESLLRAGYVARAKEAP